jgi:SAM-dependent methyltransferase
LSAVERSALAARTLQIPVETWLATLAAFEARLPLPAAGESADEEIERCLAALAPAYRARSPHKSPPPAAAPPRTCAACGMIRVRPLLTRRAPSPGGDIVYGSCDACGHGALWSDSNEAALRARYTDGGYYNARDAQGVGYDGYDAESLYRESKGARLIERAQRAMTSPAGTLLEVGSGYGYTRVAAGRAGWRTAGVDVSAHSVAEARRRYGLDTFHGTLGEALAASRSEVRRGAFDAVIYQFVLEHVADPVGELELAREALARGGWLVMLVPSMEAAEIAVFGGSYRSFRADHLHLFSRASLAAVLRRAGFSPREVDSHCNIHLFRGLLSEDALARLYATGRGPDLFVLARRL